MSLMSSLIALASQSFPRLSSRVLASSGYTLDLSRFGGPEAFSVWTVATAERQDRAWQPIVQAAKTGRPRDDVAALVAALTELSPQSETVLEVGCGGGYNSEIINSAFSHLDYHGIDISEPMIAIAEAHYPARSFEVGSAYELPVADNSFDVVVDGVALIHMPEWQRALPEYVRAAKNQVILHGLTLTETSPTTLFAKYAYGQPAQELVFNRSELLGLCQSLGLTLAKVYGGLDYDLKHYLGVESVSETWAFELRGAPAR